MENVDVGNTVQHMGLQVAAAEEVNNRLENGGGGDGEHEGAAAATVSNGGAESGHTGKRKRGRPRKQLGEIQQEVRVVVAENPGGPQKRGRGRPRGSGKWQTLATSLGLSAGETGGSNFTPYIIEIQAGENIVQRIWSFSQMTSDSICILSASGTVSTAEIFLPAYRGGISRYEGQFTIVCLNGSHIYDGKRGDKTRLLSVQLADSDGRFCGGAVGASLIAAGPTQIIVSTFKQKLRQQPSARPAAIDAPKPNDNGAVAAPLPQSENGRASETTEAQPLVQAFNAGMPSYAQPADWDSLQPSSNV